MFCTSNLHDKPAAPFSQKKSVHQGHSKAQAVNPGFPNIEFKSYLICSSGRTHEPSKYAGFGL